MGGGVQTKGDWVATIEDITPKHLPIGLAKDMLELAPRATAGAAVMIYTDEDGDECLWFDMCGDAKRDILWALNKLQLTVLGVETD